MLGCFLITLSASLALAALSQFPFFRRAMAPKAKSSVLKGKRLEAHQQKEATQIIDSFSSVVNESAEVEIAYVSSKLRENLPLLYTVSGLLKSDSLVALLDGRIKKSQQDQIDSASSQQNKTPERIMPMRFSKFKDLGGDASAEKLVLDVRSTLEPVLFNLDAREVLIASSSCIGALCMALRVAAETFLPSKHFDDIRSHAQFQLACEERYKSLGRPSHGCTLRIVLDGFYLVDEKSIYCALDNKVEKTMLSFPHADTIEIIDKYNIESGATLTSAGVSTEVKNLSEAFNGKDTPTFDQSEQWELPSGLFGVKPAKDETKKRKMTTPTKPSGCSLRWRSHPMQT